MRRTLLVVAASLLIVASAAAQQNTLRIGGMVAHPQVLTAAEIASLPHQTISASAHNQKGDYSGVPLTELLKRAGVASGEALRGPELAKYVVVTGADGYRAVFALAELDSAFTDRVVLLVDSRDGKPLPDNAAPFQLIVPGEKRPARWVRQVVSIDVREAVEAQKNLAR
jgi:DMSO/TMAO reductase YedYZ molybdopterin-dependent catalytic subunit